MIWNYPDLSDGVGGIIPPLREPGLHPTRDGSRLRFRKFGGSCRHPHPRRNRSLGKAELLPRRRNPGQLDSRLTELGWVWSRHLDFLSETTTVASARMSASPGYFQYDTAMNLSSNNAERQFLRRQRDSLDITGR